MFARINWSILILLLLEMGNASLQENNPLLFREDQIIFEQQHSSNATLRRSGNSGEKSTSSLQSSEAAEEQYIAKQKRRLIQKCDMVIHGCTDLLILEDMHDSDITMIKFRNITELNIEQRRDWNEFLHEFQGNLSNILFPYDSRLRNQVSELEIIKFLLASFNVICQRTTNRDAFLFLQRKILASFPRISNPDIAKPISKILETFLIKYETKFLDAQNSVKILQNFYNNKINYEIDFLLRNHCFNEEMLPEILENAEEINTFSLNVISLCRRIVIFHNVVEPILIIFLFVGNIVGNGTLLFMFARHKEVRTLNNIMIFNLAINDILSVTIGVPLSYITAFYPQYSTNDNGHSSLFAVISGSIQFLFFMISAMSILALSVQRYLVVARPLLMSTCCISNRTIAIIYILSVWIFVLVIYGYLLYQILTLNLNDKSSKISPLFLFGFCVVIFILVPIIASILNILTSRRLKQSLRELPGEGNFQSLHKMRNRGSKVSIFLAIAFFVSYFFPFLLLGLIPLPELHENLANLFVIGRMVGYLFYISVLVYPLALYISSNTYKSLYNKYLFRCCKSDKVQNVVVAERPPRNNETGL